MESSSRKQIDSRDSGAHGRAFRIGIRASLAMSKGMSRGHKVRWDAGAVLGDGIELSETRVSESLMPKFCSENTSNSSRRRNSKFVWQEVEIIRLNQRSSNAGIRVSKEELNRGLLGLTINCGMSIERRVTRQTNMLRGNDCLNKIRAIVHEDSMRRRVTEVQEEPTSRRADHGRKLAFVSSGDVEWLFQQGDISQQRQVWSTRNVGTIVELSIDTRRNQRSRRRQKMDIEWTDAGREDDIYSCSEN